MIIYSKTKREFEQDVVANEIENKILNLFERYLNKTTSQSEINSWKCSMQQMYHVISDDEIPNDTGIAIEYVIPSTSKRIDFIVSGKNEENLETIIIIELKQWTKAELTNLDGIINTFIGGGIREQTHPSYQAWTYAKMLKQFNKTAYTHNITISPCAYLHNYVADDVIRNDFYKQYLDKAPLFLKSEVFELRDFIKNSIKFGDDNNVMERIDNGEIKPSKVLAESVASMLKGNGESIMIDDQKIVFEYAKNLAIQSN